MRKALGVLSLLWFGSASAIFSQTPPLAAAVDTLLSESPSIQRGFWGASIVDVQSGRVVFEHNASSYFVPASNMKLLTTALALTRLGPDFRFTTRVLALTPPDSAGTVNGDLVLEGGGDPTLSGRPVPYDVDAPFGDPLATLDELAREVYENGVRRVRGGIIGDDTAYEYEPFPAGWALNDALWEYGAAVSALTFNDNAVRLRVRPGRKAGDPARLWFDPPTDYFQPRNRILTVAQGVQKIFLERDNGSRSLELWGAIPLRSGGASYQLGIDRPALFAAMAFRDALRRQGVAVEGDAASRHRYAGVSPAPPAGAAVVLAQRSSPPLSQLVQIINKVSQNLHAELLLREVARRHAGQGSRQAGIEELKRFLQQVGWPPAQARIEDGSGLSRLDLLTPGLLVRVLLYMYNSPNRQPWVDSLPIGGKDGTLHYRFRAEGGDRIRAKTGTISHVSSLSGYLYGAGGRTLAFSILVNNVNAGSAEIRRFIDKLVLLVSDPQAAAAVLPGSLNR